MIFRHATFSMEKALFPMETPLFPMEKPLFPGFVSGRTAFLSVVDRSYSAASSSSLSIFAQYSRMVPFLISSMKIWCCSLDSAK